MRPQFGVSYFTLTTKSQTTNNSTELPPKHISHVRLASFHRRRNHQILRPQETNRSREELPQDQQIRHEIQRPDAKDEGRSGKLRKYFIHTYFTSYLAYTNSLADCRSRRSPLRSGTSPRTTLDSGLLRLLSHQPNLTHIPLVIYLYIMMTRILANLERLSIV